MTYRALIPALALLAALAACENKPAEAPKATTQAKVTPLPPAAPAAPAASAGQDATAAQASVDANQGAAPAPAKMMPACKGGANCEIKVMVSGDPCRITKHPDTKHVARGHPEKLTWTIQNTGGANWDFDTNGIAFSGPDAGNFSCKSAGAGKYECQDSNPQTTKTAVPYTVKVKDGTKACSTDPMIVNGADDVNNE